MIVSIPPNAYAAAGATIVSVDYPTALPYNATLSAKVLVNHNSSYIPTVDVFYAIIGEAGQQLGGWRISRAETAQSDAAGFTLFIATMPNQVYETSLPYNSTLVFYVDVRSPSGETLAISTNEADRWNPDVRGDKFVVLVIDPYPPDISQPTVQMMHPEGLLLIKATVTDYGSHVKNVTFHYGFNENVTSIVEAREIDANNTYWAAIAPPSNAQGSRLIYYVVAVDNAGNLAETPTYFYDMAPPSNPSATLQRDALILGGVLGTVIVASVLVVAVRRPREIEAVSKVTLLQSDMLDASFIMSLATVSFLVFQLAQGGSLILGLVLLVSTLAVWGALDPRVDAFPLSLPLHLARRTCSENPLSAIMFVGYFVILVGVVASFTNYLLGIYAPLLAYSTASTVMTSGVFLIGLSIVLQLAWPRLQRISVSIKTAKS